MPGQERLGFRLVGFLQIEASQRLLFVQCPEEFGHVIAQRLRAGGQTQPLPSHAAKFGGDFGEVFEEGRDELGQTPASGRQGERTALEKPGVEGFLKRQHLPADGRLLNTVRDVPHRLANTAVLGDVIKKFEVMNVHGRQKKGGRGPMDREKT